MKTAVVLGAGFSKNSGLPVQSEIPGLLIGEGWEGGFEQGVTAVLKKFMEDVFGYMGEGELPNLDDIFTCIDISTNSGHHLGIGYSPLHLRAVRRMLVYRVYAILERYFRPSRDVAELIGLLSGKGSCTGYITLNWDTVLEKYLLEEDGVKIDYCNGGREWKSDDSRNAAKPVKTVKTHGSCNWLYCDNCRELFYDTYDSVEVVRKAGFQRQDFELFEEFRGINIDDKVLAGEGCRLCGNRVSSHIATFSYRKSFRANSFPSIWKEAENLLAEADRWVFIGYSLPEGDYEFKHLLKIAELKMSHVRPENLEIDVVLLNSDSTTIEYRKLFGSRLNTVCNGGIKEYAGYLKSII